MKWSTPLIVLFIACLFCSWQKLQQTPINKANWLVGTWKCATKTGSIYETWARVDDTKFIGKSYRLKGNDTSVMEAIQLIQKENSLVYIPTVTNQNNNLPVSFPSQSISTSQLVFENAQHDFPQIITYRKINADSLVAETSGKVNGKVRIETFPMKRIK